MKLNIEPIYVASILESRVDARCKIFLKPLSTMQSEIFVPKSAFLAPLKCRQKSMKLNNEVNFFFLSYNHV